MKLNLFIIIIVALPILASIVAGFLGRKLGIKGSQFITCFSLLISSSLISYAFYEIVLCGGEAVNLNLGSWVDSGLLTINWEFKFDNLSISLGLAVLFCSTLIHIYSISYLESDPHIQRFFSYLCAFTGGMLLLVFGGNYFVMFVGWEAIGVFSYLLINFYYTRIQANKAAILAFTMNRTGDMVLSIGFFGLFGLFGTLNYETIFSLAPNANKLAITIISLLLIGGSLAKSAQIPLHSWLPGSMEAPTPVSALLHAATLVTAGVYLLLRSSPILEYSPMALLILTFIGSTTAFVAASSGLVQNDLKRIVAFSTISQLGYMMMAVGLSQYNVALFHVINHSFFKALLFLASGSIIHSAADQQDVRRLGGLIKFLPVTYSLMMVGTISLMALPFVSGYYSKDLILELAYGRYSFSGIYAFILGSLTAFLTAFYSFRLISLVFLTNPNGPKESYLNSHESSFIIIIPMLILGIFSIFFGYIFSDLFVGIGTDFFTGKASDALYIHPNNITLVEAEFSLPLLIKLLPTILSITGALLAIYMYNKDIYFIIKLTETAFFSKLYTFLNSKYFFDVVYNNYIITKGFKFGYKVSEELDKGVIELVGPYGLSNLLTNTAKNIAKLDTGLIPSYIIYIISGFMFLILFTFAPLVLGNSYTDSILLLILYIPTFYFITNLTGQVEQASK